MKHIKTIEEFQQIYGSLITEKKEEKYEYGCAMLYFDFPEINKVHEAIDPNDLYEEEEDRTYGIEEEPHTTLLYGLHEEVSTEDVKTIVDKFEFGTCKIYNASLFENEKYDVLKFDVKGENLKECNKELSKLPHTTNFPDYHPHMTIAYLKPGKGKKYTEILKDQEFELMPTYAIYSTPSGEQIEIKLSN
jgi:2'-5' RNA ligase